MHTRNQQGYIRWKPPLSCLSSPKAYIYIAILILISQPYYYSKMGEFSECPHCEYSGRNQQSLEDHINYAHPEVKDSNSALEVNEREEESIDVDLTEHVPPTHRTPERKFSQIRTPEEVITPK